MARSPSGDAPMDVSPQEYEELSPKEYEELRKKWADMCLADLDKRFFAKSAREYEFYLDVLCSTYCATIIRSRMLNLKASEEVRNVR